MSSILLGVSTSAISITLLIVYALMMIGIALYYRKKANSLDSFFLGGRGMGGWFSAFSYGTTYFSAVVFIGYAGKFGWGFGLAAAWIGIGNALIGGLFSWKFLANRTRKMTRGLDVKTMPQFFERRYASRPIKLVAALIIFIFLIPYSSSVYQGLSYVFATVFGLPYYVCVLIMAGLTACYLFAGGYLASSLSDFVQGTIMIIGVIAMLIIVMTKATAGDAFARLSAMDLGFIASAESPTGFFGSNFFNVAIILIMTSLGICALPQSIHKFYAIRDDAAIKKGTIVSTIFCLIIAGGAYFMGGFARFFVTNKPASMDEVMPKLLESVMPPVMMGIIAVLIFAASMSTLSSVSLAGSSAFAVDFYKGFAKRDATDNQTKNILRIMCLLFIVISVILAIAQIDAIVTLMGLSWGVLAGCFIGPYFYGLYSHRVNKVGAWASIIACPVITLVLILVFGSAHPAASATGAAAIIKGGMSYSPVIAVICMVFSLIITPVASLCAPPMDEGFLRQVFGYLNKTDEKNTTTAE